MLNILHIVIFLEESKLHKILISVIFLSNRETYDVDNYRVFASANSVDSVTIHFTIYIGICFFNVVK